MNKKYALIITVFFIVIVHTSLRPLVILTPSNDSVAIKTEPAREDSLPANPFSVQSNFNLYPTTLGRNNKDDLLTDNVKITLNTEPDDIHIESIRLFLRDIHNHSTTIDSDSVQVLLDNIDEQLKSLVFVRDNNVRNPVSTEAGYSRYQELIRQRISDLESIRSEIYIISRIN